MKSDKKIIGALFLERITVSAPASIANVGPGFDVFGFALDAPTDIIHATKLDDQPKKVIIEKVNNPDLPTDPTRNTAGISAKYILEKINADFGVSLVIKKGMGIGTGLGSSAASAAASAKAVQYFSRNNIQIQILLEGCIKAEESIDGGIHGDNVVPSFLGGFIVIPSSRNPLLFSKFEIQSELRVVLAIPPISILTADARRILPKTISLAKSITTTGYAGLVMAGIIKKDLKLMGKGIFDPVIEPVRAKLIPNFYKVKKAALEAGAYGCSISGAGPTVFAISDTDSDLRTIGKAMAEAFGLDQPITVRIGLPNNEGAKILARSYEF
ncbi:MAG: Homoserine kinase [Candidatus Heimdallarchaeota archaeon LC_3]|nr:MAG: Homoserine kinase [Candidatus Heimdallarchaeota archaeon LC_3]